MTSAYGSFSRILTLAAVLAATFPFHAEAAKKGSMDELNRLSSLCIDGEWETSNPIERVQNCSAVLARYDPKNNNSYYLTGKGMRDAHTSRAFAMLRILSFQAAIDDSNEALKFEQNYTVATGVRGAAEAKLGKKDEALRDLGVAIEVDPKQSFYRLARANLFREMERGADAMADVKAVLDQTPSNLEARELRARLYGDAEQYDLAITDYLVLSQLKPKDGAPERKLAELYEKKGDDAAALQYLAIALTKEPADAYTQSKRIRIRAESKDPKVKNVALAIEEQRTFMSTRKEPNADDNMALAKMLMELNRNDEALATLEEALRVDSKAGAEVFGVIAEIKQKMGNYDEAVVQFGKALERARNESSAGYFVPFYQRKIAQVFYDKGDMKTGIDREVESITKENEAQTAYLLVSRLRIENLKPEKIAEMLALVRYARSKLPSEFAHAEAALAKVEVDYIATTSPEDALDALDRAKDTLPPDAYHSLRGDLYGKMNQPQNQVAAYDMALTYNPKDLATRYSRAVANFSRGYAELALADFDGMLAVDPKNTQAHMGRAHVHERLGEYAKAVADGEALILNDPASDAGYNVKAWNLFLDKKYDAALEVALKAVELTKSETTNALDTLGHIYQALGRPQDARDAYRKGLAGRDDVGLIGLYQAGLAKAGLYKGPADGKVSPELATALDVCAQAKDCQPVIIEPAWVTVKLRSSQPRDDERGMH